MDEPRRGAHADCFWCWRADRAAAAQKALASLQAKVEVQEAECQKAEEGAFAAGLTFTLSTDSIGTITSPGDSSPGLALTVGASPTSDRMP